MPHPVTDPLASPMPAESDALAAQPLPPEQGGAKRTTEPTRYGDWEIAGKCVDF